MLANLLTLGLLIVLLWIAITGMMMIVKIEITSRPVRLACYAALAFFTAWITWRL